MSIVRLPYNFTPYVFQRALWNALFRDKKRVIIHLAHRRAGKDFNALNMHIASAVTRAGQYYHMFPTSVLAKQVIWQGFTNDSLRLRECFHPELLDPVRPFNSTDMTVTFGNGSIYKAMGTDDPNKAVGTNALGFILSEYAIMDPRTYEYIKPIFMANKGYIIFAYTPRGRNHGFDLYQQAYDDIQEKGKDSMYALFVHPVSHTGMLGHSELDFLRSSMPKELFEQEYYCSFRTGMSGSYYGDYVEEADLEGRIGDFPYNPDLPVHTAWDLGVGDSNVIIFFQKTDDKIIIIDYLEDTGRGLDYYIEKVMTMGYKTYGEHHAPHDINVRELSTGRTRFEIASDMGVDFNMLPRWSIDEGINAVRQLFGSLYFNFPQRTGGVKDFDSVGRLLGALRDYHKKWDGDKQTYADKPMHNWASHPADALRYLAMGVGPREAGAESAGQVQTLVYGSEWDVFGDGNNNVAFYNEREYNALDN